MRKTFFIELILVAVLLFSSCVSSLTPTADLSGEWKLTSLNGKAPLTGSSITAKFENGDISGSTGCNNYGGQYELDGEKITFSAIFQTEMACLDPQGVMEQESEYTQTLSQTTAYSLSGNQLLLKNASGDTILEFSR
jgi:heat shock protein HslJ